MDHPGDERMSEERTGALSLGPASRPDERPITQDDVERWWGIARSMMPPRSRAAREAYEEQCASAGVCPRLVRGDGDPIYCDRPPHDDATWHRGADLQWIGPVGGEIVTVLVDDEAEARVSAIVEADTAKRRRWKMTEAEAGPKENAP